MNAFNVDYTPSIEKVGRLPARRRSGMLFASMLVACCLVPGGDAHGVPDIRWWGEFGYDLRVEDLEPGTDLTEHACTLRMNASTYIYEPWFATVNGNIRLSGRRADLSREQADSNSITGDIMLRMFPKSRFPLEVFADRTDTQSDTNLAGLDVERTRYGTFQQYVTRGGTGYRFRYEHTDLTNLSLNNRHAEETRETNDVGDFFQAGFRKAVNNHNVIFSANYNRIDTLDSPRRTRTLFSSLRHSYQPGPSLTAHDMLTYTIQEFEQAESAIDTGILQLTSYAFWRPDPDKPLRVSATLRALTRDIESQGGPTVNSKAATTTMFATYEADEHWILNGGFGLTATDAKNDRQVSSFETARATYTSTTVSFRGFDASWFGQGELGNSADESATLQSFGTQAGYSLSRSWPIGNGTIRGQFRQSLGHNLDTDEFSATRLLSNVSLVWSAQQANRSTIARFSFSDSRTKAFREDVRDVEGEFQIGNLQLSISHRLTPASSLSGNITLQAIREFRPSLADFEENGVWRPTATADLSYFANSLFNINRLSFRSTLRFISDAFVPLLDEPRSSDGRDDNYWENRFEYFVGRIRIRVIGRVTNIRDTRRILALVQIRRVLGEV